MSTENWLKCSEGPVVLTEGSNDCHVIAALCQAHEVQETFGFYSCGSDDQAIKRLRLMLLNESSCPKRLAIVLDADAPNLRSKWQAVSNILKNKGYNTPSIPNPNGTILKSEGMPIIGVWLMPDNTVDGMLEDFCMNLAPEGVLDCMQEFLDNTRANGIATFKEVHNSKALIHCYLSTQDEPGSPLGLAITKKVLSPNEESAVKFTNWLTQVFN